MAKTLKIVWLLLVAVARILLIGGKLNAFLVIQIRVIIEVVVATYIHKTLGRALDPRANGTMAG